MLTLKARNAKIPVTLSRKDNVMKLLRNKQIKNNFSIFFDDVS